MKFSRRDAKELAELLSERARKWKYHHRRLRILLIANAIVIAGLLGIVVWVIWKLRRKEKDKGDGDSPSDSPGVAPGPPVSPGPSTPPVSTPGPVGSDPPVPPSTSENASNKVPWWIWLLVALLAFAVVVLIVLVIRERRKRDASRTIKFLREEIERRNTAEANLEEQLRVANEALDQLQEIREENEARLESAKSRVTDPNLTAEERKSAKTEVKTITKIVKEIVTEEKRILVAEGEINETLQNLQSSNASLKSENERLEGIIKRAGLNSVDVSRMSLQSVESKIQQLLRDLNKAVASDDEAQIEALGEELTRWQTAKQDMAEFKQKKQEEARQFREANKADFEDSFNKLRDIINQEGNFKKIRGRFKPASWIQSGKDLSGAAIQDLRNEGGNPKKMSRMELEAVLHLFPDEFKGTQVAEKNDIGVAFVEELKKRQEKNEKRGELSPSIQRALGRNEAPKPTLLKLKTAARAVKEAPVKVKGLEAALMKRTENSIGRTEKAFKTTAKNSSKLADRISQMETKFSQTSPARPKPQVETGANMEKLTTLLEGNLKLSSPESRK